MSGIIPSLILYLLKCAFYFNKNGSKSCVVSAKHQRLYKSCLYRIQMFPCCNSHNRLMSLWSLDSLKICLWGFLSLTCMSLEFCKVKLTGWNASEYVLSDFNSQVHATFSLFLSQQVCKNIVFYNLFWLISIHILWNLRD